jgi:ribonucleoside-triphosphate reductase|tara:strand:+ start:252 stop:2573 length:2322 start_codon:yes stop_codon:yes gene_type:complete
MIKKIRKRDGTVVLFDKDKIAEAIWKSVKSVGGHNRDKTEEISNIVSEQLGKEHPEGSIPGVEMVQDLVEKTLIEKGHAKTAKSYILYRKSHEELRDVKGMFDTIEAVEDYIGLNDWMIKENSNMGFSLQGLNNYIATKIITNYWMRRIYPESIRKAHEETHLHIHDLGTLGAYCVGWDLKDLLVTGFKGVPGKVESRPAKHLRTALGQMVNFFYTLQGETAGAQAFSNFDTLLAPFIRYDNLNYDQVKQAMQEFLFNLAVPTRVGFQTPFTNITMDLKIPEYMKNEPVIIAGQPQKETYKEFQDEMDMINKAFAEVMIEGDASGRVFTFPIPTYNITKDFDWDNENYDLIWEMTAKYGIPYFSNFINSDMNPEDSRSMCCRLRLDQTELRKRGGGLFGANPQTGSIGVVTINIPRIGFTAIDENDFLAKLGNLMEQAKESLEIKRKTLERFTDIGLYPYSRFYLRNVKKRFDGYWKNHFATIGLLGMNEAIINFMPGEDITTEKGRAFSIKVLDFMREKLEEYQSETGNIYNLEATPGEGTTYRFANSDRKRFGKIIVANEPAVKKGGKPYYTNSSQLPVDYTDDLFEALELQDDLQIRYTGGTVFHTFVGEKLDKNGVKLLIKKIAESFRLPYFTLTPTFSICPEHGYLAGDHEYCPKCDEKISYKPEAECNTNTNCNISPELKTNTEPNTNTESNTNINPEPNTNPKPISNPDQNAPPEPIANPSPNTNPEPITNTSINTNPNSINNSESINNPEINTNPQPNIKLNKEV